MVIFWVATTWLGAGISCGSRVLRREPVRQGIFIDVLFWGAHLCGGRQHARGTVDPTWAS
ncbi:hypothetical protein [Limosilactobacillus fermentum]